MSRTRTWMLRAVPRVAILGTIAAEILRGDALYGAFCFIALVVTLLPALRARRLDAGVPIEIELVLLWFMVTDMTFGNWFGMYRLSWYDKALHLSSSILIAWLGFLTVYVMHLTQRTQFRPLLDALAIFLVTLGIGALWEIAEYGVDQLFGRRTQGAPHLSPIDDTMFDLMLDGLGAVIGSLLGPLYILHARRSRATVGALAGFIERRGRTRPSRLLRPARRPSRSRPRPPSARPAAS